jgi:type II secretory pathway component PulM
MTETFATWWRARTGRERLLVSITLWLSLVIAVPLLVWQGAASYRVEAAARLARAESLRDLVARLDPALVRRDPLVGDNLQAFVRQEAAARRLRLARVEQAGPGHSRFIFEPGDSLAVLTLIDALTQAGLTIDRTRLVRMNDGAAVAAELDVRGAGS